MKTLKKLAAALTAAALMAPLVSGFTALAAEPEAGRIPDRQDILVTSVMKLTGKPSGMYAMDKAYAEYDLWSKSYTIHMHQKSQKRDILYRVFDGYEEKIVSGMKEEADDEGNVSYKYDYCFEFEVESLDDTVEAVMTTKEKEERGEDRSNPILFTFQTDPNGTESYELDTGYSIDGSLHFYDAHLLAYKNEGKIVRVEFVGDILKGSIYDIKLEKVEDSEGNELKMVVTEGEDCVTYNITVWSEADGVDYIGQEDPLLIYTDGDTYEFWASDFESYFTSTHLVLSKIFSDCSDDAWYAPYVLKAYKTRLMQGKGSGIFAPNETLARAQFAVILYSLAGCPDAVYTNKFPDVAADTWYTNAVMWANKAGIINGYQNNGHFGPADNITRGQMAIMMMKYAERLGCDTSERASIDTFTDRNSVPDYTKEALQWAVAKGIISGKDNGTRLDANGKTTRAECASIISRFMEKVY